MPTIRQQIKNQQAAFGNALVSGGMGRAAADIFAEALTEIVALKYITKLRRAFRDDVKAQKILMRSGSITRQEYDTWLAANRPIESATIQADGTVEFLDESGGA